MSLLYRAECPAPPPLTCIRTTIFGKRSASIITLCVSAPSAVVNNGHVCSSSVLLLLCCSHAWSGGFSWHCQTKDAMENKKQGNRQEGYCRAQEPETQHPTFLV